MRLNSPTIYQTLTMYQATLEVKSEQNSWALPALPERTPFSTDVLERKGLS